MIPQEGSPVRRSGSAVLGRPDRPGLRSNPGEPGSLVGTTSITSVSSLGRHDDRRDRARGGCPGRRDLARAAMTRAAMTRPAVTRYLTRDRAALAAALAAPPAAAAVLLPFRASWPNTNVALLLVVVVVAVAAIGNRVAGALAAVSAAAWFDFFFTVPYERFSIRHSADVTTAVLLLLTGLAVSQLAARARRLQVIAITDAGYLAQIHETASLGKSATLPDAVVDHVKE